MVAQDFSGFSQKKHEKLKNKERCRCFPDYFSGLGADWVRTFFKIKFGDPFYVRGYISWITAEGNASQLKYFYVRGYISWITTGGNASQLGCGYFFNFQCSNQLLIWGFDQNDQTH